MSGQSRQGHPLLGSPAVVNSMPPWRTGLFDAALKSLEKRRGPGKGAGSGMENAERRPVNKREHGYAIKIHSDD